MQFHTYHLIFLTNTTYGSGFFYEENFSDQRNYQKERSPNCPSYSLKLNRNCISNRFIFVQRFRWNQADRYFPTQNQPWDTARNLLFTVEGVVAKSERFYN